VQHAASLGYTTYKFKCRPWWDPLEQVEAVSKVAPPNFRVWLDFNGHLREARLALPILKALANYECVGGIESPIPQRDVEGYQIIRRKIDKPIAIHYGGGCCHVVTDGDYDRGTSAAVQIREQMCDGFVTGGDVNQMRGIAGVAHEFRKPFWIQVVGTALRAAWVTHLASTLKQATLSSLAAHDLWVKDIAAAPRVVDGLMPVPEGAGLGVEVNEGAMEELRNPPPAPAVKRISTVVYPSGVRWHFANEQQRHEAFYFGHLPGFVREIRLEVREDDGSKEFAHLHARCETAPVVQP
jgi:galactonate dehydratase